MFNLQYLAGLIDGEGYISLLPVHHTHNKYGRSAIPVMKVSLTGEEGAKLLEELQKQFGGKLYYRVPEQDKWSPSCQWTIVSRKNIQPFLQEIIPFLHLKKEQAKLVLEFCKLIGTRQPRETLPEREVEKKNIWNRLKNLKQKKGHRERLSE